MQCLDIPYSDLVIVVIDTANDWAVMGQPAPDPCLVVSEYSTGFCLDSLGLNPCVINLR